MNYSYTIRRLRESRGMKQIDLGCFLGVSAQAISKWENEKAQPDIEAISKMCDLFNVSADYIIGRTDDQFGGGREEGVAARSDALGERAAEARADAAASVGDLPRDRGELKQFVLELLRQSQEGL